MTHNVLAVVLIALTAIACWFAALRVRAHQYGKLRSLAAQGDRKEFLAQRDSNVSRATVSLYAREFLTLQLFGRCGSDREVREQTNVLMKMRLSDSQLSQVLGTAFEILARRKDVSHCRRIVEEMEKGANAGASRPYRVYFDTVLQGRANHRDELERRLVQLEGSAAQRTRGYVEYLLSKSYEAAGDRVRSEEMRTLSARDYAVDESELEESVDIAAYV